MIAIAIPAVVAAAAILQPAEETLHFDRKGRPAVAVTINGYDSFFMIVDTAAETSFITPALVTQLGLPPIGTGPRVRGATGSGEARLYPIDRLSCALFTLDHVALPALSGTNAIAGAGVVGMDLFADLQLVIDRSRQRVAVRPSAPPAPGMIAIKATQRNGLLMTVPVTLNGTTVQALIDSGADSSIANTAALKALGWAAGDPRLTDGGELRGATAGTTRARIGTVEAVRLGPATFRAVPIVFADAAVGGDAGTPAMILGADLLNALGAYALDFPRRELQIAVPRAKP